MKVYACISAVQKALSEKGISKDGTNTHFNYSFRGIDQIYQVISPLLHEHGLLILPKATYNHVEHHTDAKDKLITHVYLDVEYVLVCVEDGSQHTMSSVGEAMDTGGDKASNKALSAAYKYAVIQAFAIPVEGEDDADSHSPQAQGASQKYQEKKEAEKAEAKTPPSKAQWADYKKLKLLVESDYQDEMDQWIGDQPSDAELQQAIDAFNSRLHPDRRTHRKAST